MRTRLRQIVLVAADLEAAERRISDELGIELCYRDPGVASFGLTNALFPVGDSFLEVVSPTESGTTAGRLLDKRQGDSGYMVMLEVSELEPFRVRAAAEGVRIAYEARTDGIVGIHLHPGDLGGAILSLDQTDTWGEWPWAGPTWRQHVRTERVDEVLAVIVEAHDPNVMADRWARLLGRPVSEGVIELDQGEIRFVQAGDRGEGVAGFVLRAAHPDGGGQTSICGCRFHLVPS